MEAASTTKTQTTMGLALQAALEDKNLELQDVVMPFKSKSAPTQQKTSRSEKSSSILKGFRLSRTLKRNVSFRDIDESDVKYLWAHYKKGGFDIKDDLEPEEFKEIVIDYLTETFDSIWIVEAETKKGFMPVGIITGVSVGKVFLIEADIWFMWASKRNIYEGLIYFVNKMRKQVNIIGISKQKMFLEKLAKHGIMRRVGTLYDIYEPDETSDGRGFFYQSRKA